MQKLTISENALNRIKVIQEQEGKRTVSIIGQAFQYDTLNDRLNPTEGYKARLDLDYFWLTGDAEHLLT